MSYVHMQLGSLDKRLEMDLSSCLQEGAEKAVYFEKAYRKLTEDMQQDGRYTFYTSVVGSIIYFVIVFCVSSFRAYDLKYLKKFILKKASDLGSPLESQEMKKKTKNITDNP